MATYADTTINVIRLNSTIPYPGGTHYTVPAGRRAKLHILSASLVFSSGVASLVIAGGVLASSNVSPIAIGTTGNEYWAGPGDTITSSFSAGTGSATVNALIEEYANP